MWPLVAHRIGERVTASMVYVEEKGLKIRGRWPYGFVVVAVATAWPVLAALLPSRRQGAWRWLGRPRHQRKPVPRGLIPAGLQAYTSLVPAATHVLCRFHHQPGVTHWFPPHFTTDAEINARQPVLKRLFPTHEQRPVRRRLARLQARAAAWGMTPGVTGVEAQLPPRMGSVGSNRVPSTTKAIARFCRAFARFDNTRQGWHAAHSATRELLLWLVVSVLTPHASTGQAPIAVILPEARYRPLYRLLNDPFRALQERGDVKREVERADWLRPQAAAAELWCGATLQRSHGYQLGGPPILLDDPVTVSCTLVKPGVQVIT